MWDYNWVLFVLVCIGYVALMNWLSGARYLLGNNIAQAFDVISGFLQKIKK